MTILAITQMDGIPWLYSISATNTNQIISSQESYRGETGPQKRETGHFFTVLAALLCEHSSKDLLGKANVLPIMCRFLHSVGYSREERKPSTSKESSYKGNPEFL